MLAAIAHAPGPAHTITIDDVPEPQDLTQGEVVVRMLASTFNPSDAIAISGTYASRTSFPMVPGFEGVGTIERIGPGVPTTALGQRVLPIGSGGAWQQLKRTEYSWCIPVPGHLSTEAACFAYINSLTAYLMVERFCGDATAVLIDGAATTIAGHLKELLEQRGITTVMVGRDWEAVDVEKLKVDVVFDCVGGATGRAMAQALKPGGRLVHYGLLSGEPLGDVPVDVSMFRLRNVVHAYPRERLPELFTGVFEQLRAGHLRTQVATGVELRELPDALRTHQPRAGKLLIRHF